ncbi:MAG: NADH-quinone oxidoreductase subunit C [Methanobacteriota archaeon]|nr:MAG: NADH-quinone oxidoreductase subunit C [Euryarchaeota archaeon]
MSEGDERGRAGVVSIEKAPSRIDEDPGLRVLRAIADSFPEAVSGGTQLKPGVLRVHVERADLYSVCRNLKESLGFEHLTMISAVDYEDRFEIVYHITSYEARLLLELITSTPKDDPSVDSISTIWGGANWQEREAFDLMGVVFRSHPKLERILLPKDVLYHPLRKDFKG